MPTFDFMFCPCNRPAIIVGLGVENIGGGGIGPISDNGIGGSGNSDSRIWFCIEWWCIPSICGGGVEPGWPVSSSASKIKKIQSFTIHIQWHSTERWCTYNDRHGSKSLDEIFYCFRSANSASPILVSTNDSNSRHAFDSIVRCSVITHCFRFQRCRKKHQSSLFSVLRDIRME